MAFKIQNQEKFSFVVNRDLLQLVYDFDTKEKQPKTRGAWKLLLENLPGNIVVKNCVPTGKPYKIYACHANLKCEIRINLSIAEVRNNDKCICDGDPGKE